MNPSRPGNADGIGINPEVVGFSTRPDYFDRLERLRTDGPVHRYAPHSWTVARYDDVRSISRDTESFCSGKGVLMNDPKRHGQELPGSILHMDAPDHAPWRALASRWFTPRAVTELEDRVRQSVLGTLDRLSVGDEVDLVADVAAPIPVMVIAELLGVSSDIDPVAFRRWSDACIEGPDASDDPDLLMARMGDVGELFNFLKEQIAIRRAASRDDLMTTLIEGGIQGRDLTDGEIVTYCMALLVAGNETTRHLISGTLAALADHPDQRAALVGADREVLAGAVEEGLRWVTPIQAFARTAKTDVELSGQQIEANDWVVMLYASANRDEKVFGPAADRFDVMRPPKPTHLAFGFGPHLCLGASLARLEARIFLEEFLSRFPSYEVAGPSTWAASTLVRGYATLSGTL